MPNIKLGHYSALSELYMQRFYRSLNEKNRRHYVAVEAEKFGYGGVSYIARLLDCSRQTIHTALIEIEKNALSCSSRVRIYPLHFKPLGFIFLKCA